MMMLVLVVTFEAPLSAIRRPTGSSAGASSGSREAVATLQ